MRNTTRAARPRRTHADKEAEAAESHALAEAALTNATPEDQARILAVVAASPVAVTYSPRNLLFVLAQARKRGMHVTALDSYTGWIQRGREVNHGQKALRLFARKIIDGKPAFRPVATTFDVSQTRQLTGDEWDEALAKKKVEPVTLPSADALAAECTAAFAAALAEQAATRFGTAITGTPAELLSQSIALAQTAANERNETADTGTAPDAAASDRPALVLDLF